MERTAVVRRRRLLRGGSGRWSARGDARRRRLDAKRDLGDLRLLQQIEDRHGLKSTLIASQLPVDHWHDHIGEATLADAILDRLLHNSHRLPLKGESMRKIDPKIDPS